MRSRKIIIIFLVIYIFSITNNLLSKELKGVGYGKTEDQAKVNALSDLSSFIQVDIESVFESLISEKTQNNKSKSDEIVSYYVKVKSELPVLGAEYKINKLKNNYYCEASLDSNKSLPLYESKLRDLQNSINKNYKNLTGMKNNIQKYNLLNNLITEINQFEKLRVVAVYLGSNNAPKLDINLFDIKSLIYEVTENIESIDLATKRITENIKLKKIFIYPPTVKGSKEITQFAAIFKENMSKYLNIVNSPEVANYYLKGSYDILKDRIFISYQLLDKNFNILNTFSVNLKKSACENLQYEPKNIDFTKALEEGLVLSNDFKIEVMTNYGKEDLLFKKGDQVEIFVKMNRAGYFYVVGHINKKEEKYSYLLEINPQGDYNRKFVYFINQDDVNKWVSIGKFEIMPPFGLESLQFIASNRDLVDRLPKYKYDNEYEYYVLTSTDVVKNIANTRGMKPVKTKEELSSEAILLYTTIE